VIVGTAGGEYGIRGFLDAYDAKSGERSWRFYTIPGPGEPGHETWAGDSWMTGGGSAWVTGSYDPELNLVYWGIGNPAPDWNGDVRMGDNLYTDSAVALDADTGELKWHFQFTPHDEWDWDSVQVPVLADREFQGRMRKVILWGNRNGFFYVLDRETGEFLQATEFVRQTWNDGFGADGRPLIRPGSEASEAGNFVYPSVIGGTNFQAPSYSPETGWVYVQSIDFGQNYVITPAEFEEGAQYLAGGARSVGDPQIAMIKAINPDTGAVEWEYQVSRISFQAGVLATGGNLVFAATSEGNLIALEATSGELLWRFQTGATMQASPMSYAVDGKQFVAVSAGQVLYSFALPE
jgi:alcohol dehydrogenase (cytochrome c)